MKKYFWLIVLSALAPVTFAACGSPLHLGPENVATGNGAPVGDANATGPSLDALKCTTGEIAGARLSNCTCSTDNNRYCPIYATEPNVSGESWACTTIPVAGGYTYSCQCNTSRDANDTTPECSSFYDPANAMAVANPNAPQTTCQTVATSFGFKTDCSCVDTNTAPCSFFQGNSYTTDGAPYAQVCGSTLDANGVTTVCTCNQLLQNSGVACPTTFVPDPNTVPDLIY